MKEFLDKKYVVRIQTCITAQTENSIFLIKSCLLKLRKNIYELKIKNIDKNVLFAALEKYKYYLMRSIFFDNI